MDDKDNLEVVVSKEEDKNIIDVEAKKILDKIASQSITEINDESNFDDLVKLFNANQLKKTMQRILKSNELLDKVTQEALQRFNENPNDFTTQDLLNYMRTVQDSINVSQKTLAAQQEQTKVPLIQINQQTINNTESQISKESQEKIVAVVEDLIKMMNAAEEDKIIDGEIEDLSKGE